MPHINLPDAPGILAGFAYAPELGAAMSQLAEVLLRGPSPLSEGERELIAALVSHQNSTQFCTGSHAATAAEFLGAERVDAMLAGQEDEDPKMEALLVLASTVTMNMNTAFAVEGAKRMGASDREIHDAIAIAAAFNMYNRYVDGLGTNPAEDYCQMGADLAKNGYVRSPKPFAPKERKSRKTKEATPEQPEEATNG